MSTLPPGFVLDNPGPVQGPPPVIDPLDRERVDIQRQGADIAGERLGVTLREEDRADRKEQRDIDEAVTQKASREAGLQRAGQTVLRSTTRALEYLENMIQDGGVIGAASRGVQSKIPGTGEYQFTRQINDLSRNIGLDRLQQMRESSPTGGALGQVPVQQQKMLEETLGSFDITQPGEVLKENLNQLNNIYLDIMFGSPAERAVAVQQGRMTAEQSREIDNFYRGTEFNIYGRRRGENPPPGGVAPSSQEGSPPQSRAPTSQEMYPQGIEFGMDKWGRDGVFDAAEYLRETYGIEPEDERRLVGMLNASRGNPDFSPDDVRQIYEQLNLPQLDDEQVNEVVENVRTGQVFGGIDTSEAEAEYRKLLESHNKQRGADYGLAALAAQGAAFGFGDEVGGVQEGLNALKSGENPITGYRVGRDSDRLALEGAREDTGGMGVAAELGGTLLSGGIRAVPAAMRAARPVAAATREGAILGGVAGAGYGEGPVGTVGGAALGSGLGAGTGATLQAAGRALAPTARRAVEKLRGRRPEAGSVMPIVEAGERRGVTVRRADVDPEVRGKRADLLQGRQGQNLRAAESDDLTQMEDALLRDLGSTAGDDYASGKLTQRGVSLARDRMRTTAGVRYRRAHGQSGRIAATPERGLTKLDEQIAELEAIGPNQNKEQIKYLGEVREDLSRDGGMSIEALRAQRTGLRGNIKTRNLDMTDAERRVNLVLDEVAEDIAEALADKPEALALFRSGDELWRRQAEFGQRVVRQLVGTKNQPVPPETAARRVLSFVQKDANTARAVLESVPPSVRAEISGLVAKQLGRSTNGQFSLAQFLTHTGSGRGARINNRTARLLFGDEGMQAISDLRVLARAKQDAAEMTNRSNAGNVVQRVQTGLRRAMLAAFGISEGGVTGGGFAIAAGEMFSRLGEGRGIRLLLNPDFTKWLRTLPNSDNPRAIDNAFDRLRRVASRDSAMLADVQALERGLLDAINDNAASRLAADSRESEGQ